MCVAPCPVPLGEKGARGAEATLASALMRCRPCNHSLGHPEHVMSVLPVSGTSLLFLPFPNLPQAGDEQGCLSSPCRQFRPLPSPPALWDWPRDGSNGNLYLVQPREWRDRCPSSWCPHRSHSKQALGMRTHHDPRAVLLGATPRPKQQIKGAAENM